MVKCLDTLTSSGKSMAPLSPVLNRDTCPLQHKPLCEKHANLLLKDIHNCCCITSTHFLCLLYFKQTRSNALCDSCFIYLFHRAAELNTTLQQMGCLRIDKKQVWELTRMLLQSLPGKAEVKQYLQTQEMVSNFL